MRIKKIAFLGIVLCALYMCFGLYVANAATLFFSPTTSTYTVGQTFTVNVIVSSSAALNAVGGIVIFPSDKLQATSVSKANSIISFWVEEPSYTNANGTVQFEGIVPNPGYTGTFGRILSITFRVIQPGESRVSITNGSVLANDGQGTQILNSSADLVLTLQQNQQKESEKPTQPQPSLAPAKQTEEIKNSEFSINIKQTDATDPNPHIILRTNLPKGELQLAEVKVGEGEYVSVPIETLQGADGFTLPRQAPGKRTVLLRAYDKAGVLYEAKRDIEIAPIQPPKISLDKIEYEKGEGVLIKGSAIPESLVNVYIRNKGEIIEVQQAANKDGEFQVLWPSESASADIYEIWGRSFDRRGAESYESEPQKIVIKQKPFYSFLFTMGEFTAILIVGALLLFVFASVAWYCWHLFHTFRRRTLEKTKHAELDVHAQLYDLRALVAKQIHALEKLKKSRSFSQGEEQVMAYLKKHIDDIEKLIQKDIQNIGK